MDKGLLKHIITDLKNLQNNVLLVENNDGFLFREDLNKVFNDNGIRIVSRTSIQKRIDYELRSSETILVLLSKHNSDYLEDIKKDATTVEFFLEEYLNGFHIPSTVQLDLDILEKLYTIKPIISLSKKETLQEIEKIRFSLNINVPEKIDMAAFIADINKEIDHPEKSWNKIAKLISKAITDTIGTAQFDDVMTQVNNSNKIFQEVIQQTYQQTKNASSVKKPKIVSKILDYINFNFKGDKIALIVVDGLAYWQYEILKKKLPGKKIDNVIYSWIPSITQLSRQAIFRGDTPHTDYVQGPINEKKLWLRYWKNKGLNDFEVGYAHENVKLENLALITKYALVFKDLDEKMHSSSDYKDLLKLTENWVERSQIVSVVENLLKEGFKIFLTTDHGNIQARGWRGLQGKEKLGTNKSGSRSERHIEYSEKWLFDEFIKNNPDIADAIVMEEKAIYFRNDQSFSRKDTLVTHGGAHLLEVLIPFIEIIDEK
ncbi:MAG: hypothetical protein APF83_08775 [Lutibacter sp. BRH_c52]|nr:MAG: hypothetical protein APF83_08775 [Lutibacter sp. BRH_c52]